MNIKMIMRHENKKYLLIALLIAVAVLAGYIPALSGGYIWGESQSGVAGPGFLHFFEREYHRPLDDSLSLLGGYFWGTGPRGYHALSLIIHCMNSALVFTVGALLFENAVLALVAALLFALHPVHTEAVSWISARADLLMTLCFVSAFALFLWYRRTGRADALVAGGLLIFLSAMSGQDALVFPLVVILAWRLDDDAEIHRKRAFAFLCASMVAVISYLLFMKGPGKFSPASGMVYNSVGSVFGALAYYLEKLVIPVHLSIAPAPGGIFSILMTVAVLLAFLAFFYQRARKKEFLLVLWILITLSPSLLIAAKHLEPAIGERFLYLPSVGFCLLAALFISKIKSRTAFLAVVVPIIVLYSLGTYDRAQAWKDDISIWKDAVSRNPDSSMANINYGVALIRNGEKDRAVQMISDAVVKQDMSEDSLLYVIELFSYLEADFKEAEKRIFERLMMARGDSEGYGILGHIFFDLALKRNGDSRLFKRAIQYFTKTVELSPSIYEAHYYMGESYMGIGDFDKARDHLERALELGIEGQLRRNAEESIEVMKTVTERRTKDTSESPGG